MSVYEIYKSPIGAIEAVKKGWSWPGFFFTWIWALTKKMFVLGGILFCIGLVLMPIQVLEWLFYIICAIWFGNSGNDMRSTNLRKRGFEFISDVTAETSEGAIALFLKETKADVS